MNYRDQIKASGRTASDRRSQRTRQAVFEAFSRLVLDRRYDAFSAATIIAEARIGRSTFYEHFQNKDDVLLEAIEPIFFSLVDAAAGKTSIVRVEATLEHIWQQRSLARIIFEPPLHQKLRRKLATMIEHRLSEIELNECPTALVATAIAASQMAMLQMWIAGNVSCKPKVLATMLLRQSSSTLTQSSSNLNAISSNQESFRTTLNSAQKP
jgi:AcrR family transcriptional regulator